MYGSPTSRRPPAVSVGELTRRLKGLLESSFRQVWVEGEMGQVKQHHSGHVYFTLKDADARIDGVVWRTTAWRMRYQPVEGHRVVARGTLSVHAPRGAYTLIVDLFLPAGAGDLQAAFAQLKQKLSGEGLFDRRRKKAIPTLPRAVGVVTSSTGAAFHDIRTVLHRRAPQIPIVLYPAQVQGDGAARDVIEGITRLSADPRIDVIIVGRGGGSLEDLWTFNEEAVARAIAACPVPIISAVGHETDTTISDLVADARAATPSEAAERAVPNRSDLLYTIDGLAERLSRAMALRLERSTARTTRAADRLARVIRTRLDAEGKALTRMEVGLRDHHPLARITKARGRLDRAIARLSVLGPEPVRRARRRLISSTEALQRVGPRAAQTARGDMRVLVARLDALSPLASLGRGYSITRSGDAIISRADAVEVGDVVEIGLHHGRLSAQVTACHLPEEAHSEDEGAE